MTPDRERLQYLFGEDALEELDDYDLTNEADVIEAIDRFLPLPDDGEAGVRRAIRTVTIRQILDDTPPAAWRAVVRMRDAGLPRERVLGQLAIVVTEYVLSALQSGDTMSSDELVAGLDALPLPSATEMEEALLSVIRADSGMKLDEYVERTIERLGVSGTHEVTSQLVDRVLEELLEGPLHLLPDDTTIVIHDAVAGKVFTHRLTDAELELQVLTVSVDLAAFSHFGDVRLAHGREVEQFSVEPRHLAWRGPDGWLAGYSVDDLLVVRAEFSPPTGGGEVQAVVTIEVAATEPPLTDEMVTVARAAYEDEHAETGMPVSADELTLWLCARHPELFAEPTPPLRDWVEAAGLELRGGVMAHDASVWARDVVKNKVLEVGALAPDRRWREVLGRAVRVLYDQNASPDDVRTALAECAEPEAIEVLADVLFSEPVDEEDEYARRSPDSPGYLFEIVERATALARRPREVATAQFLACVLREQCGQPLAALAHLTKAVEAQPRLGAVVERIGWYCFDRGDARGAMRWWNELADPHPAAATIATFLNTSGGAQGKLGRNDPCWCGSGRKFKQCHQASTELPALPDRVGWLCQKATQWLEHSTGEPRALVAGLALAWATGDPDADDSALTQRDLEDGPIGDRLQEAFTDPILFDAALYEGGLFNQFLHHRGELLPDDERLLAAAWLTIDRGVHEVTHVEPGVGMTLRNLATGDVAEVRERSASRAIHVGERWCARVVPDGQTHQVIGGLFPVTTGREEAVMAICEEGDPYALCAWAGALRMPPRIEHRPGMIEEMFDRDALQAAVEGVEGGDDEAIFDRIHAELSRQAQARWLDEHVPALGGLTPREAAADPTRREQLERLLVEFDQRTEMVREADRDAGGRRSGTGGAITYDTAAIRRELGLA